MGTLDLTTFGFTPTESLIYEVLLRGGPGTGYAVARAAGLARANAYGALEGLVQKGVARVEEGRPKRYRPEPPAALLARILDRQGQALDEVSRSLEEISVPETLTLVELSSARGALQIASREAARATSRILLHAPPDAYPPLTPSLRKAGGSGVALSLSATAPVELPFADVSVGEATTEWPGQPFLMVVDGRSALLASREGDRVLGHWGTAPTLVAAATLAIGRLRGGA
ncbi:MAG TPA: helix-turn-helix domain-containing protein [Gemmatimonadales bacterium]|nr:helix-turn-helix domain-containing protein [Gemmatimonadales bacterium]